MVHHGKNRQVAKLNNAVSNMDTINFILNSRHCDPALAVEAI